MHRILLYAAYGWLVLSGSMIFTIDVVSQYVRGKRVPGPETTLYYGLMTSFALGQVLFGLLCLWLSWKAPEVVSRAPVAILSVLAALVWLLVAIVSIEYREPKLTAAIFTILILLAVLSG